MEPEFPSRRDDAPRPTAVSMTTDGRTERDPSTRSADVTQPESRADPRWDRPGSTILSLEHVLEARGGGGAHVHGLPRNRCHCLRSDARRPDRRSCGCHPPGPIRPSASSSSTTTIDASDRGRTRPLRFDGASHRNPTGALHPHPDTGRAAHHEDVPSPGHAERAYPLVSIRSCSGPCAGGPFGR